MVEGLLHATQARPSLQDRADGSGRIAEQEDRGELARPPQGCDSLEEPFRHPPSERHTY